MSSYEQILQQINEACHVNNANAFEMDILSPISWRKTYRKHRFLFADHWECIDSEENCCHIYEQMLSKLPKGISYNVNTIITNPLPDISTHPSHTAHETHISTYKVIVSESYSKGIALKHTDANVILSNVFDSETVEEAERFKNHIIKSHKSIVRTLSQDDTFDCLTNVSFGNSRDGITYVRLGMKPLSSEAQRLGLALAISTYNSSFIKDSQFYFIARSSNDSIHISKSSRISCKSTLKDW